MDWTSILNKLMEFNGMRSAIQAQYTAFWADNVLFTWRWWLKVALLVLPWVLWFLLRKKDSSGRLLAAGIFMMTSSIFLDEVGSNLGLWLFAAKIMPFLPGNTVYNVSVIPVAAMLAIQFFPKTKPVFKALAFAALGAFVFEPLLVWVGYYRNIGWTYWYSFPVLFVQYWIASRFALYRRYEPLT